MNNKESIAEFVGIMLGDGNLGIYKSRVGNKIKLQHRVRVSLDSRNIGYTNHVVCILREVLGFEPRVSYKKTENGVDVGIYRKDCFLYVLEKIGLKKSPKWNNMEIPIPYRKGKLSLLVMKGLFDTDGCLSIFNNNGIIYPRIEIRLCPSPAQKQINEILEIYGFRHKIQQLERGKTRIRISGNSQLRRWFDLIGSSNPIHMKKSIKFVE